AARATDLYSKHARWMRRIFKHPAMPSQVSVEREYEFGKQRMTVRRPLRALVRVPNRHFRVSVLPNAGETA
ncbi:MAG: hypothetical protein ACRECE_01600, partial [Xanthobacteraceae bacterium]